jgi:hypothetical protein
MDGQKEYEKLDDSQLLKFYGKKFRIFLHHVLIGILGSNIVLLQLVSTVLTIIVMGLAVTAIAYAH